MKDEPKFQNRYRIPSNRLFGWNYNTEGAYFLTICTYNRLCLFGEIIDHKMILNDLGHILLEEWEYSACLRSEIILGPYVIMPNHFHAIVHIVGNGDFESGVGGDGDGVGFVETHGRASLPASIPPSASITPIPSAPVPTPLSPSLLSSSSPIFKSPRLPKSISSLMAGFKSIVTKKINTIRNTPGEKVWQSNYHDHIIRNNQEYQRIADYIEMNPECWQSDALR